LRRSLEGGSEREIAIEIAKLLAVYPVRESESEMVHTARTAAFMEALRPFPTWALRKALSMWTNGEHQDEGDNIRFCPVPAQIVRLIKIALKPAEQEIGRVEAIASAVVDQAEPPKPTMEELKARFGKDWGLTTPEDEERLEREKEAHRAVVRRGNELARKRDFEAHGMEYKPGSLAPSPALLSLLGKDSVEAAE
jgi:hypothetical protein